MTSKRLVLTEGESFVVFPLQFWEFLSNTFDELAKQWPQESDNRRDWLDIKQAVLEQAYSNVCMEEGTDDWED